MTAEWRPADSGDGYLSWSLPSSVWSGEQYGEDTIKVHRDPDGAWTAYTEMDQCGKRDLDEADIVRIRAEFDLDQWIR